MPLGDPKISPDRPVIRQLDDTAINRIAAGEVVERPASAVKELVENALDAGASRITVEIAGGGKALIRVTDDGCGMSAADLPLALSRHATSKIDGHDLLNIHSFGFRGEALPSLGAVGRLRIVSRTDSCDTAHEIRVAGGKSAATRPAALGGGTMVELRDLFFATPARLKFLRTDRAETQAITDVVKRLAMAAPDVAFTLRSSGESERLICRYDAERGGDLEALAARVRSVIGSEFVDNALQIDATREEMRLSGLAGLPTYARGTAVAQFFFVNGRPVRDKQLLGALRAAYMDVLSRDRHPAAVLFLDCPPERVDVNVHPAKAEVRFRDPGIARGLIVSGLRHALAGAGHRASSTVGGATLGAFRPATESGQPRVYQMERAPGLQRPSPMRPPYGAAPGFQDPAHPASAPGFLVDEGTSGRIEPTVAADPDLQHRPLGAARAQLHENYIVAQTATGMILVDQHAAHERLVYEKLKAQLAKTGVARQALLIPEIVTLDPGAAAALLERACELAEMGLIIEAFGASTIAVREVPALLGTVQAEALIRDILDEIEDLGESQTLRSRLDAVLSRVACHGSVRSGRRMSADEMNALLREMEATPHSGQCNHGRPTYVELPLRDIERLFGRT